ncbi:MAG: carboxypeptidase-like regulatory domain-containing protein [bacterium]
MMKRIHIITGCLAFSLGLGVFITGCHHAASEPNVKIVGVVTDQETGQPIAGARVADHVYNSSPSKPCQEAWTGPDGKFALATWYEEHSLVASAPGYPPVIHTLQTKNFGTEPQVEMNISLKKQTP